MRKILLLFIFLFLIINLNSVIAISFSPGDLIYEINAGEKECKIIIINSASPTITISNRWAENKSQQRIAGLYNKTSNYHGLSLDYPKEIKSKDKQFEVCISGKYSGEFYGIIIIQEEQVGNTIMQGGVWLKVIIKGDNYKPENWTEDTEEIQKTSENNAGITGAVIGAFQRNIWTIAIIFFLILILIYSAVLIHKRRNNANNTKLGKFKI